MLSDTNLDKKLAFLRRACAKNLPTMPLQYLEDSVADLDRSQIQPTAESIGQFLSTGLDTSSRISRKGGGLDASFPALASTARLQGQCSECRCSPHATTCLKRDLSMPECCPVS